MATIDNPEVLQAIMDGNGVYPGDEDQPPVVKIVSYDNQWGGSSRAVVYAGEDYDRYEKSMFCRNVQTIWTRKE